LLEEGTELFGRLFQALPEGTVLCDGDHVVRMVNPEFCLLFGYREEEVLGRALDDLVIQTPQMALQSESLWSGILTNERMFLEAHRHRKDGSTVEVSILGVRLDLEELDRGSFWIYRDISRQKATETELCKAAEALSDSVGRLDRLLEQTIGLLSGTIEKRDPYTVGHQKKVAQLAEAISRKMGLKKEFCHRLYLTSLVHDIGKISIPAEILTKPYTLTAIERNLLETHSRSGYEILEQVDFPWPLSRTVLQHHERLDGSGYPEGLKGDSILLEARILAVADVVEAISADRPYRAALGPEAALDEIRSHRGSSFDPDAVDACLALFEEGFRFNLPGNGF
jgi:PAS domain S-box-containing protein/putative nucleotidyltransferase with HDIG domain